MLFCKTNFFHVNVNHFGVNISPSLNVKKLNKYLFTHVLLNMSKSTWTKINLLKKKHCIFDLIIFIDSILSYWTDYFFLVSDINKFKINERQNMIIVKIQCLNIWCSVASGVNLFSVFLIKKLLISIHSFFKTITQFRMYMIFLPCGWSDDLTECSLFFQNMPYNQGLAVRVCPKGEFYKNFKGIYSQQQCTIYSRHNR